MDDLIAFVTARLDEDEAAAYKAAGGLYRGADGRFGGRPHWSALGHGIVADAADPDWGVVDLGPCIDDDALAEHIARHDPARVLREVAAKRQLMEEISSRSSQDVAEIYLAALAAIYSDHPDCRPEWKP
jgi:hypothetical protein